MEQVNQQVVNVPKKKKSLFSRIFTIVVGSIVGLLLLMQIMGAISAQSNYGVQRFGDYQILVVVTDSMEPYCCSTNALGRNQSLFKY
jgi:hypothetical protein